MSTRRPITTGCELVVEFSNVFDHIKEPETEEEIDEILRESGYDPDVVGSEVVAFVDELIRNKDESDNTLNSNRKK